jgi:peptide/nickel transport system permease protein
MLGFVLRRVAWAIVLLFAISIVTFVIFYVVPHREATVGGTFGAGPANEDFGVNRFEIEGSVIGEYGRYVGDLVRGDLGTSRHNREDVTMLIGRALPPTISLLAGGALLWMVFALVVGVASGLRPRGVFDRVSMIVVLAGISAHPLWIGYISAWLFGFKLRWLPLAGYCDVISPPNGATCGGPVQWAYHLILPWLVFAIGFAALYARMIRASVLEHWDEDYVRTATAKGLSRRATLRRHVMPNAMLPIVAMLGMDGGVAFAGSIFVERVFQIPGLGYLLVQSVRGRDLAVTLGVMLVVSVAVVVTNLIADLVIGIVDPRVGGGRRRRTYVAEPAPAPASAVQAAPVEAVR